MEQLAKGLEERGWSYSDSFISSDLAAALNDQLQRLQRAQHLRPAQIGRGDQQRPNTHRRGDQILWIEDPSPVACEAQFLAQMGELRDFLKRYFFVPLKTFESHYAVYTPGTFYERHLDQHAGQNSRQFSCVLFLNSNWRQADEGCLRLYNREDPLKVEVEIEPVFARLAIFLSDKIWHEVRPTKKDRFSVTGWMRC